MTISRRAFLLSAAAAAWSADREDALAAIEPLASALSEGDADSFMRRIPKDAGNYAELEANVRALLAMAEVTSSVEVRSVAQGKAELDWSMHIRAKEGRMLLERRRGNVALEFQGTDLRSLAPASFFAAPNLTGEAPERGRPNP